MTAEEKIARRKLSLLDLTQELRNVSKACKVMGYSRQQFYEIRRNYQTYGSSGRWISCRAAKVRILTGCRPRLSKPFWTTACNALPMAHYGCRKNWPCAASRLAQAAFEASGAGMTFCPSRTVCCDWNESRRIVPWSSAMSRFACWNALALSSGSGRFRCITPANWLR